MSFYSFCERSSCIHGLDPRAKLAVCLCFVAFAAFGSATSALGVALAASLLLLSLAKIRLREIALRLLGVNFFIAVVALSTPDAAGGFAVLSGYSPDSLQRLASLALRCNAILIAATALASSIDMANFGHALAHFGLPDKLSHLLLFTVRQLENMRLEYLRLKDAMRARAFRPRCDLRTYKSLATLAAMLLLRSFDRAERISEAMKCRNFNGHFHLMRHFEMRRADWIFVSVSALALCGLLSLEALCKTR